MSDESKAIEEVAKTTGKAIDAGRKLGGFLARYVGGSIEQAMGIVEDQLRYTRWERQMRLADRATDFLAAKGLSGPTKHVPLQLAIPLIQAGSLETNDELQDRWAALLANAADADFPYEVRRAFVSILEDLTHEDALILSKIYSGHNLEETDKGVWTTFLPDKISATKPDQENVRPPGHVQVSLGNLARLGLISSGVAKGGLAVFSCVRRTVLGSEFMQAISHDSPTT